jgi:hypothetical protein
MNASDSKSARLDPWAALQDDVSRLLFAGAPAAIEDERLARGAAALGAVAGSAPVVQRITQQCAAIAGARDASAAGPLLHLAATCAQVRGARTSLAPCEGALVPLAPRMRLGTRLSAELLSNLKAGRGLGERVDGARIAEVIEDGSIADLRLLPYLPRMLEWPLDGRLAMTLLRAFGEEGLRALVRAFVEAGPDASPQHLRALAAILPRERAIELTRSGWERTTGALRAESLRQWALLEPERAAEAALGQRLEVRDRSLVEAVCEVLAALGPSDRALEVLVDGVCRGTHVDLLCDALERIEHPRRDEALLARFAEVVRDDCVHNGSIGIVRLLGRSRKDEAADALLGVWRQSDSTSLRVAAGEALLASDREDVHRALVARWEDGDWVDRRVGRRALLRDPARWFDRMGPWFTAEALASEAGRARAVGLLQGMVSQLPEVGGASEEGPTDRPAWDPRWEQVAVSLLEDPTLWKHAVELLTRARSEALLPWAIARLGDRARASTLLEALGRLGDRRAAEPIAERLRARGVTTEIGVAACEALRAIDEPRVVPALRATIAELPERRRRGALAQACEKAAAHLERERVEGTVL